MIGRRAVGGAPSDCSVHALDLVRTEGEGPSCT